MALISRLVTTIGLILLAHAGYSAHEHSLLYGTTHALPQDITLETLLAIVLVTTGLVLGAEKLKPISWSVWAGEIEQRGGADNPFRGIEERIGFWDVRAQRKEFASWMKEQNLGFK
ncbi:hypothetical protein VTO42DRAFT_2611 [Malbranchea cinnamomea]